MPAAIRVLVVDDTDHVRRMLMTMLGLDGFDVVGGAHDGPTAIIALSQVEADVVVVDYRMPAMDGLETAWRIRGDRPGQRVILYTAFVDEPVERAAARIGVSVCAGKVDGLATLVPEIRRLAALP